MKIKNTRSILILVVLSLLISSVLSAVPVSAAQKSADGLMLVPGGMTFGVQLQTKGVLVVGLSYIESSRGKVCPASDAGVLPGDILYEINSNAVNTVDEVTELVDDSQGEEIQLSLMRNNKKMQKKLKAAPDISDGAYKAGILIRDNTAGIGTVTYIDKDSGSFAGLGHGICDSDTGALMPLLKGRVCDVTVTGIKKGECGTPGEIRGYFGASKTGALIKNTPVGVYGSFDTLPSDLMVPIPVGDRDEIQPGKAYIYSGVDNGKVCKYEVKIVRIVDKRAKCKNFVIEVTDERLLGITGGIVQGMSGSPIVQNGKLVGAVTHVMINDPHRGYGIFIENMLERMPELSA